MAHVQAFSLAACFSYFITLSIAHFSSSESIGFSLKLIPLFSPESPLYPGNLTRFEKMQRIFKISKARAHYISSMSIPNAFAELENISLRVHEDNYFYSVVVFLGTPMRSECLLLDTGSFLIWTQCQPCVHCFNQTTAIFNPNASSSYVKIPCNDPRCRQPFWCENGECIYRNHFNSGAYTGGFASTETFTFPVQSRSTSVPGMIFGCSNDNRNFPFKSNISGILGMNASPLSLLGQLRNRIQGLFSYCLVNFHHEMEATSILRFGQDVITHRRDFRSTPIMHENISPNFYLYLLDISVGDRRIGFAPGTFSLKTNGTGGCVIDTGTVATVIQKGPYEIVMQHFDRHLRSFGCQRIHYATHAWDYCYRYNSSFRAYASMTFHFLGADLKVEPAHMYFVIQNQGFFCVALSHDEHVTILGAWQQQNMRFVYDLNAAAIRFAPENCANDHM